MPTCGSSSPPANRVRCGPRTRTRRCAGCRRARHSRPPPRPTSRKPCPGPSACWHADPPGTARPGRAAGGPPPPPPGWAPPGGPGASRSPPVVGGLLAARAPAWGGNVDVPVMLRRGVEEFGARVGQIGDGQWDEGTPNTEWSVRDLVSHVLSENLWAPPLLAGSTIGEVGDRFDGDVLGSDPLVSWREGSPPALAAARQARAAGPPP